MSGRAIYRLNIGADDLFDNLRIASWTIRIDDELGRDSTDCLCDSIAIPIVDERDLLQDQRRRRQTAFPGEDGGRLSFLDSQRPVLIQEGEDISPGQPQMVMDKILAGIQ